MAYPASPVKKPSFMQFGWFNGIAGDVTTDVFDRNYVPAYKVTWADIRKIGGDHFLHSSHTVTSADCKNLKTPRPA